MLLHTASLHYFLAVIFRTLQGSTRHYLGCSCYGPGSIRCVRQGRVLHYIQYKNMVFLDFPPKIIFEPKHVLPVFLLQKISHTSSKIICPRKSVAQQLYHCLPTTLAVSDLLPHLLPDLCSRPSHRLHKRPGETDW